MKFTTLAPNTSQRHSVSTTYSSTLEHVNPTNTQHTQYEEQQPPKRHHGVRGHDRGQGSGVQQAGGTLPTKAFFLPVQSSTGRKWMIPKSHHYTSWLLDRTQVTTQFLPHPRVLTRSLPHHPENSLIASRHSRTYMKNLTQTTTTILPSVYTTLQRTNHRKKPL